MCRAPRPTVYYLPGTTGWTSSFAGRVALLWNPVIQIGVEGFGLQTNHFGFSVTGSPYIMVVVEASGSLSAATWTPLLSFTLTNGPYYFSDPWQSNMASRYYRLAFP